MTRRSISQLAITAQTFLYQRDTRKQADSALTQARDWLKPYVIENGYEDDRGHRHIDFEEPLTINGVTYTGLVARKAVSPFLRTDDAQEWLAEHGLLEEVMVEIPARREPDWEMVYILNQEGKIPDEVLDSLEDRTVTWSLLPEEGS